MKIHVLVHQDSDGLWAEVPALPYIVVNGQSHEDLLQQVREAINLYFESAAANQSQMKGSNEKIQVVELSV